VLAKLSKFQIRLIIGVAAAALIWPLPSIVGSIQKVQIEKNCAQIFQTINQELIAAETDTNLYKYIDDAKSFAVNFVPGGIPSDCVRNIGGDFPSRIRDFYAAVSEYERIMNTGGTTATPPILPYKSAPNGSKVFGAFCESPTPLLLRFKTRCYFLEDMKLNLDARG
jgi:hypothetical protein